ncbi:DUF3810 domain-containing protein [Crassaminicella thermophila]|uniref:DUF3810 domain-containing protein n=1 Tax=Crassaminicella thermophila TaxID=2599308 RepID=A0A5C0SG23_CRATE|nr:DUF3810 domain-containing protein [Crassaminicella thermophila]QEK11889.1 DUF3810 domain-containing protein [Crassaminicella thermophila]
MKNIKKLHKFIFILLLPIGILLFYTTAFTPYFIETIYSKNFYKLIVQGINLFTGLIPFSIAELLILFLIFFIIWSLIQFIIKIINKKHTKKSIILQSLTNLLIFVSIIYFLFIMLWGLNYNRLPFSKIAKLNVQPASIEELEDLCKSLIDRANTLRSKVAENKDGIMYIPNGHMDVLHRAYKGYEIAANIYPELSGRYANPKGIFFSKVLSYMGISGIYCPFTGEANVNIDIPHAMLGSTACHEMAHQRGFSREDEANYIAYITCNMNPDIDFQYSGTLLALIHSMNALFRYDQEKYHTLHKKYSEGLIRDLSNLKIFWQRYEGPIERASTKINNAYLKSNRQKDGIHSYGRMVDLLIAEHRLKMLNNIPHK